MRMPPGHHAGSRGRAVEVRRVEVVQPQSGGGQRVEVRRLEFRMAVVSCVAPALVVGHHEDDIRAIFAMTRRNETRNKKSAKHRQQRSQPLGA
jgi:hypothetical protein